MPTIRTKLRRRRIAARKMLPVDQAEATIDDVLRAVPSVVDADAPLVVLLVPVLLEMASQVAVVDSDHSALLGSSAKRKLLLMRSEVLFILKRIFSARSF